MHSVFVNGHKKRRQNRRKKLVFTDNKIDVPNETCDVGCRLQYSIVFEYDLDCSKVFVYLLFEGNFIIDAEAGQRPLSFGERNQTARDS